MVKKKSNLLTILFLIGILGCNPIHSQEIHSRKCPVKGFDHSKLSACGYLEVPENRSKNNNHKIKIAYVVIKSNKHKPATDPVVYLMGGPGGSSLGSIQFWARHPILAERDLVIVDQRGTGYSRPSLCPELGASMVDVLGQDLSIEQELKALQASADECKAKLISQSIDLGAYNSKENAADLDALRKHLGYEKWNLYGGSYGTRLALTMMRDFPNGIRSVVLSGPFPPQANMYEQLIPNFKYALEQLFQLCDEEASCKSAYPNLRKDFKGLIAALRKKPVKATYQSKPFYINAQDALIIIHQLLYSKNTAGRIPSFITSLIEGNQQDINSAIIPLLQRAGAIDIGMYYTVQAYEEVPFNGKKAYRQSLKDYPAFQPGLAFLGADVEILSDWHKSKAPKSENAPVKSNIPTLIMVGELDPVTPEKFAKQAAEGLENCEIVTFPAMSHNLFGYCPNKILLSFFNDPKARLNSDCRLSHNNIIFD